MHVLYYFILLYSYINCSTHAPNKHPTLYYNHHICTCKFIYFYQLASSITIYRSQYRAKQSGRKKECLRSWTSKMSTFGIEAQRTGTGDEWVILTLTRNRSITRAIDW